MKRVLLLTSLMTVASAGAFVVAQQTSVVPQPRAEALPAPGTASPKVSTTVPKPDGVMPQVPAGFTVTTYAELLAPRMMVYAPNGDLFVSSPNANTVVVLRDANNDGTFEACSVFAAGPAPGARDGSRSPRSGRRPARRQSHQLFLDRPIWSEICSCTKLRLNLTTSRPTNRREKERS